MSENESPPRLETRVIIEISTEKSLLDSIYSALKPETKAPPTERSKSVLYFDPMKRLIRIEIISRDTTSLRAAINSYFRWLSAILNSLKVIRNVKPRRKS